MYYLLGIIGSLLLTVWYFFTKNQSAQSLIKSLLSNQDLAPKNADVMLNQKLDEAEQKKREELNVQLKNEQNQQANKQDLLDFLNNLPKQ